MLVCLEIDQSNYENDYFKFNLQNLKFLNLVHSSSKEFLASNDATSYNFSIYMIFN